jgi:hypothetical protein
LQPRGGFNAWYLFLALIALAAGAGTAQARTHRPQPTFAGLKSAVACFPGPIGGGRVGSYHLTWEAARDRTTPSRKIVYEIYQSSTMGGENYSMPTYTTTPGATSYETPPLPTEAIYFFVVRARDRVGNEDSNTVEREGQNLCV